MYIEHFTEYGPILIQSGYLVTSLFIFNYFLLISNLNQTFTYRYKVEEMVITILYMDYCIKGVLSLV